MCDSVMRPRMDGRMLSEKGLGLSLSPRFDGWSRLVYGVFSCSLQNANNHAMCSLNGTIF